MWGEWTQQLWDSPGRRLAEYSFFKWYSIKKIKGEKERKQTADSFENHFITISLKCMLDVIHYHT